MAGKKKFELEYPMRTMPKVLYQRLSTCSGLSEWFANNVTLQDSVFVFDWDGNQQKAKQIIKDGCKIVHYRWVNEKDDNAYFGFEIEIDEITEDLSLIVTDFASEDEIDESIDLWDKQIQVLQRKLGI